MDCIFEHVVNEVGTGFDEVVERLQNLQILSLLLMEDVEPILILVKFHFADSLFELIPLLLNHLLSFFYFLFLVLQLFYFFVNLFFHHLKQVLMLNLELVHNSSEGLLQFVNLFVKLFPDFHFKFVVQVLVDCDALIVFINLDDHLLDHFLHFFNFG